MELIKNIRNNGNQKWLFFLWRKNMKGKKIIIFLLAVINIFLLGMDNVYAAQKVKISFDYQSNVYYTRKGNGLNDHINIFTII